jgi:hypothetical protein
MLVWWPTGALWPAAPNRQPPTVSFLGAVFSLTFGWVSRWDVVHGWLRLVVWHDVSGRESAALRSHHSYPVVRVPRNVEIAACCSAWWDLRPREHLPRACIAVRPACGRMAWDVGQICWTRTYSQRPLEVIATECKFIIVDLFVNSKDDKSSLWKLGTYSTADLSLTLQVDSYVTVCS